MTSQTAPICATAFWSAATCRRFQTADTSAQHSEPSRHPQYTKTKSAPHLVVSLLLGLVAFCEAQEAPYPQSQTIPGITWHWDTYQTAALGSDLWPVTWGPDDNLYLSWGDGGGFGGSDSDGRVSMGFARIEGGPEHFHGFNVNGGKNPEHPSSFPKKGKTAGLICDNGILYATVNLQDGEWPNVNHVIACSADKGATWTKCDWLFSRGPGNFEPARFLNFGKDGGGAPAYLTGFDYMVGGKQPGAHEQGTNLYLARVPREKIRERDAFEFFCGLNSIGQAKWNRDWPLAQAIFHDANGADAAGMVYDPGLGCFLLTSFHGGPGQLGVFAARQPWGPWSTAAYYETWGGMGAAGEGLTCEFPVKWMSADGRSLWAIFSVWGGSAKQGIKAHDRFNLVKITLSNEAAANK
jgi:hypothetical protein